MNQGDEQHDSRGGQPDPSPVARSQQWKHTNKHQNHPFHHHHHHQCHCHHPTWSMLCCNLPKQQNRNDCDLPIIATHTAPWPTWPDKSSLNQKVLCMKFLEEQLIVVTFHFIKDCFQWWRRCRRLPSQCPLYNHATGGHILKRTGNYWKQFFTACEILALLFVCSNSEKKLEKCSFLFYFAFLKLLHTICLLWISVPFATLFLRDIAENLKIIETNYTFRLPSEDSFTSIAAGQTEDTDAQVLFSWNFKQISIGWGFVEKTKNFSQINQLAFWS